MTRAMLSAGGWPGDYTTMNLIATLAGSRQNDIVVKLVRRFGAPAVKTFIQTSDFGVADALRHFAQSGIVLPATPQPDPKDGEALVTALYEAGTLPDSGKFDVECMLDRLLSHRVHALVANEIVERYGVAASASADRVLLELLKQLQTEHSR